MSDMDKTIYQLEKTAEFLQKFGFGGFEAIRDAIALLKEDCHNCKLECLLQKYDELKEKYDKLLKEQKAVKPEVEVLNEIDRLYRCQRCHKHFFYEKQKYCDQCGQAVKWE